MTEYFCGFETGAAAHGMLLSGTTAISTTSPRTGSYCGVANPTTTNVGRFMLATNTVGLQVIFTAPFAFRFACRIDTRPASGSEELFSWQGRQVRIDSAGVLSLWATTTLLATGTTVLSNGTWYVIEAVVLSATAKLRVYASGSTPGADELTDSGNTVTTSSIQLGKSTNRNGQTVSYSFDDIRAKDSVANYLGDGKVILVKGNVSGPPTYDAFSKIGGTNIADVWNDTPFSAVTNASSAANADTKQSMWHNNVFPLGSTTINAVMTAMVAKQAAGGPTVEELHLVGGVEVTSALTLTVGDAFYYAVWPSVPTIQDLNGSQIGIFRHAGTVAATTVEDCWLQVDHSPPAGGAGGKTVVILIL
jgi:hypothetical protein